MIGLRRSSSCAVQVAKIQNVLPATKKKEKGRLKVSWYYFPEDTTGGRQVRMLHGSAVCA